MTEEIEYSGTITFEIFETAQHVFNGYRWLVLCIVPLVTLAYAVLARNSSSERIIIFVLAALSIPVLHYYRRRKWRYHYDHSPYLGDPLSGSVSIHGMVTETPSGTSRTPWS